MKTKMISRAVVSLVLCLCVMLAAPMQSFAQSSNVEYDGKAQKFVFVPENTDLFGSFKDLMPGDKVTQEITIKNSSKSAKEVEIFLNVEAVNSDVCKDFLDQLDLTLEWKGNIELLNGKASSQGKLASKQTLGTFKPGAEGVMLATITVPFELGNDYMDKSGEVVWTFTVEEKDDVADTGDTSLIVPAICLFAVSAAVLATLMILKKKENTKGAANN